MILKDHLFTIGAACVLMMSVAIAQDQAPATVPRLRTQPLRTAAPAPDVPAADAPDAVAADELPLDGEVAVPTPRPAPTPRTRTTPTTRSGAATSLRPPIGGVGATGAPPVLIDGTAKAAGSSSKTNALKFSDAPLEIVLGTYSSITKKMPIINQDVPKVTITLKCPDEVELTTEESIWAIEQILSMHGIAIEPIDEKFVKILFKSTARVAGIPVLEELPATPHPENGKTISQMLNLLHITTAEAQKALEGFKRPDGLFQIFERTNSILVTDTQENINRMLQVIKLMDKPIPVEEKVFPRTIIYAKAEDIKKRLEEFVAESQKQNAPKEEVRLTQSGRPGIERTTPTPNRPTPTGLIRAGQPPPPTPAAPNETISAPISDAERGMIRGKVHIMADERTNMLIITTREDNMNFFDDIIKMLDIETAPDMGVEVQRLEYADAEEVATKLNDLIGNASPRQDGRTTPAAPGARPNTPGSPETPRTELAAAAARANANANASASSTSGESKLGQLNKDNIKILSDKRTNAIIMMGSKTDLAAIKKIIASMDIQLAQVMIETVVVQVELGSGITAGIDWVLGKDANDYTMRNGKDKLAGGGGSGNSLLGNLTGIVTGSGSGSSGSGTNDAATVASHVLNQGINYFLKSDKLNISALIQAAQTDSRAKVLSSPILLTVDNKEASIEATSMRYLYKGVRYSGGYGGGSYGGNYGGEVPDFEQRDIGLTVKITPRISPNGNVIMTIDEKFETIGPDQDVGGDKYPTVNTRKLQADVSVENMQTIILGGLVQSESKRSDAGIPILKNIPWLGRWLFSSVVDSEYRSELLVFITPYVFHDSASAVEEAHRRKSILSTPRPWDDAGWSISTVADPVSAKTRMTRQAQEWEDADLEYKTERELEKAREERSKKLLERTKKDAEAAAKKQKQKNARYPEPPPLTIRAGGEGVQVFLPENEKGEN